MKMSSWMSIPHGVISVLIPTIFVSSFALLYSINPEALRVLDDFGLTCYNIIGMEARAVAASGYVIVGLLALVSSYCLRYSISLKAGLGPIALLALTNLIWISYGLVPFFGDSRLSIGSLVVRNFVAIGSGALGLLVLGGADVKNAPYKMFRAITVMFALSILALLFYFFIAKNYKWMPINWAFVVYFLWYAIFGLVELGLRATRKG